jgi:RHS repeat-associated protein
MCRTCYLKYDHLGSVRLVTDQNANIIARHSYLPFGEEVPGGSAGRSSQFDASDNVSQRFTGKERDAETSLDYFGARHYGAGMGRWGSADVINLTSSRLFAPSSTLNKYAYAMNNPLTYKDADGEDVIVYYHEGYPGHIALLAYDQASGDAAVLSKYPASSSVWQRVGLLVGGTVPSTTGGIGDAAQNAARYSSITIQTTPEQAQKVIQWIKDNKDQGYQLYSSQCTTSCSSALRDIGIDLDGS